MKARYYTNDQRKRMAEIIQSEVTRQTEDVATRAQALWMAAMLNAGLSPRTVNRVMAELPEVTRRYSQNPEDGDFALFAELKRSGVKVTRGEER